MDATGDSFSLLGSKRNWIQLVVLVLTLAIGWQFHLFVEQAGNGGQLILRRPPGVEGFLPIGALLGWKQFLTTGRWDPIHPAAMVILLYAVMVSLLLRKSFCSWFCPVGTLSEWLWKVGRRLMGRNFCLPAGLDGPLRSIKYLLLAFFVYVTVRMSPAEIDAFLHSPYYKLADVKMLHFFTRISTVAAIIVSLLMLLSMGIRNFWCRYLCPYGALMGVFSVFSPTAVRRRADTCTHCLKCSRVCPSNLPVHRRTRVSSPECSGCLDCVRVCPSADTLSMQTAWWRVSAWSASRLAVAVCLSFCLIVFIAQITGHWESAVSQGEFRMLLKVIDSPAV